MFEIIRISAWAKPQFLLKNTPPTILNPKNMPFTRTSVYNITYDIPNKYLPSYSDMTGKGRYPSHNWCFQFRRRLPANKKNS